MKAYVYILFSKKNGTLYVGVTSNIKMRVYEHKIKTNKGFTAKYDVDKLGYFEEFDDMGLAIAREKSIKKGNRKSKIALIESMNPNWNDMYFLLH